MRKEIISACGLRCDSCDAYIATLQKSETLRQETADKWSKLYGAEIKAADIVCDGCNTDGADKFAYCYRCEIRKCTQENKSLTCAHCQTYPCEKITEFHKFVPEVKEVLDQLRSEL